MYEKYRYSCYYWECVILLEAFLLTLLLVLLQTQNNAALQVLVAMAVIFLEAVLHVSWHFFGCGGEGGWRRMWAFLVAVSRSASRNACSHSPPLDFPRTVCSISLLTLPPLLLPTDHLPAIRLPHA